MKFPILRLELAVTLLLLATCRPVVQGTTEALFTPTELTPMSASNEIAAIVNKDTTFDLNGQQARDVASLVNLLQAYNDGEIDKVLVLLDKGVVWSDCDYRTGKAVEFTGKPNVAKWIQQRLSDQDQFEISRIANENPSNTNVVGVSYIKRQSLTLSKLGFADGIQPQLATKVIFASDHARILAFANGPIGGSPEACQLK
jgi:hypothetical protein